MLPSEDGDAASKSDARHKTLSYGILAKYAERLEFAVQYKKIAKEMWDFEYSGYAFYAGPFSVSTHNAI